MSAILDYLRVHGGETLQKRAFNAVDNLILSGLSYAWFDGAVSESFAAQPVTLREAAPLALQNTENRFARCGFKLQNDARLLAAAAQSQRYGDFRLLGYVNNTDPAEEKQFAAVTFLLSDGTAYVAFRGTDQTLIGWKEDFNMSFQTGIPSQRDAVSYLEDAAVAAARPLRLGGHSKGGNLAVYSASFCRESVQQQILTVYNNDGPGFLEGVMQEDGYRRMQERVETYLPQSSVVGMLMEHTDHFTIVRSSQHGIFQHDLYSWQTTDDGFLTVEGLSNSGQLVNRTISDWAASLSIEQRASSVDALYEVLGSTDAVRVTQLLLPANYYALMKSAKRLDPEKRALCEKVFDLLRKSFNKNAAEAFAKMNPLPEKVEALQKKQHRNKEKASG